MITIVPDSILNRVLICVADDVCRSSGSFDGDAGDPFPQAILHDPDRVLPALQQQRHDRNAEALTNYQK